MRRYPTSFLLLTGLGIVCAIPGAISLAGFGASLHPVLDDPMAGLAFIVSAVALIGSGAFPLVIAIIVLWLACSAGLLIGAAEIYQRSLKLWWPT